jgi:hypothetical protein
VATLAGTAAAALAGGASGELLAWLRRLAELDIGR